MTAGEAPAGNTHCFAPHAAKTENPRRAEIRASNGVDHQTCSCRQGHPRLDVSGPYGAKAELAPAASPPRALTDPGGIASCYARRSSVLEDDQRTAFVFRVIREPC